MSDVFFTFIKRPRRYDPNINVTSICLYGVDLMINQSFSGFAVCTTYKNYNVDRGSIRLFTSKPTRILVLDSLSNRSMVVWKNLSCNSIACKSDLIDRDGLKMGFGCIKDSATGIDKMIRIVNGAVVSQDVDSLSDDGVSLNDVTW